MSARVRVKICGLTNRADAAAAIDLGADALGFNLFPGSKRVIKLEEATDWLRALPPFVARVAVVVNLPLDEARHLAARPEFDLVQFHGDEDAAYCAEFARLGRPFVKALRLQAAASIALAGTFSTPHLLLDAPAGAAYGPAGHQTVGTVADRLNVGTPAGARVQALLGGDSLESAAAATCDLWATQITPAISPSAATASPRGVIDLTARRAPRGRGRCRGRSGRGGLRGWRISAQGGETGGR